MSDLNITMIFAINGMTMAQRRGVPPKALKSATKLVKKFLSLYPYKVHGFISDKEWTLQKYLEKVCLGRRYTGTHRCDERDEEILDEMYKIALKTNPTYREKMKLREFICRNNYPLMVEDLLRTDQDSTYLMVSTGYRRPVFEYEDFEEHGMMLIWSLVYVRELEMKATNRNQLTFLAQYSSSVDRLIYYSEHAEEIERVFRGLRTGIEVQPAVVLSIVSSHLTLREISSLRRVCKSFNRVTYNPAEITLGMSIPDALFMNIDSRAVKSLVVQEKKTMVGYAQGPDDILTEMVCKAAGLFAGVERLTINAYSLNNKVAAVFLGDLPLRVVTLAGSDLLEDLVSPTLEEINAPYIEHPEILATFPMLKRLKLSHRVADLEPVFNGCKVLESVETPFNYAPCLEGIEHALNLKKITLHTNTGIGDRLASSPSLETVILCNDNGNSYGNRRLLDGIDESKTIHTVILVGYSYSSKEIVESLSKLSSLRSLTVSVNKGIDLDFSKFESLTHLTVCMTGLASRGQKRLILPASVTHLKVSRHYMHDLESSTVTDLTVSGIMEKDLSPVFQESFPNAKVRWSLC